MRDASSRYGEIAVTTPLPFSLAFGGRELQAQRTMEGLRALGVHVRGLDPWDRLQRYGLLHAFGTEGNLWETAALAQAAGASIVVSPVLVFGRSVRAFRAWARVDRLVPMRTSFRYRRDLLKLADAVVALTRTEQSVLESIYGVSPERCHVVPNGVDGVFRQAQPDEYRAGWGSDPYVLCVGSIERRKRQLDVLRAARRAGRKVVFIGSIRRPDAMTDAFAREAEAATDVTWHRQIEPGSTLLASAYAASDALVVASDMEGMPLVALEAQAAGCPLIMSDLPQHIEAFPGAAFFRTGDVDGLAAALGAPPPRTSPLGVGLPWSWSEVAAALRRVYHAVAPDIVPAA